MRTRWRMCQQPGTREPDFGPLTITNVLAFGLPGVGKSHALCAVGHALVEAGHSVLCAPAYAAGAGTARRETRHRPAPRAPEAQHLRADSARLMLSDR